MHELVKLNSGFMPKTSDEIVSGYWEHFHANVFKPCGVLEWCPYGPIVEDFPLHSEELAEWGLPEGVEPEKCHVFGHYCPAYFRAEPMLDPMACETLPPLYCEGCGADACEYRLRAIDSKCGDPLCRSCYVERTGLKGAASLGCEPIGFDELHKWF